jgi:hypothetical protein
MLSTDRAEVPLFSKLSATNMKLAVEQSGVLSRVTSTISDKTAGLQAGI